MPGSQVISPTDQRPSTPREFRDIQMTDLQLVATLGMGGFGRVELVTRTTYILLHVVVFYVMYILICSSFCFLLCWFYKYMYMYTVRVGVLVLFYVF